MNARHPHSGLSVARKHSRTHSHAHLSIYKYTCRNTHKNTHIHKHRRSINHLHVKTSKRYKGRMEVSLSVGWVYNGVHTLPGGCTMVYTLCRVGVQWCTHFASRAAQVLRRVNRSSKMNVRSVRLKVRMLSPKY